MNDKCCETVQRQVRYWVQASHDGREDGSRFGPVATRDMAEQLLLVIAARPEVVKATILDEVL